MPGAWLLEFNVNRQDAIEYLLEHYDSPRNYGALPDADVVLSGGQPECSDTVTIYLKLNGTRDHVERVTFEGQGCTISQAAASILTEIVVGKSVAEVEVMDFEAMIDLLGREVVGTRPRCATLALGTLKAAVAQQRRNQTLAELHAL